MKLYYAPAACSQAPHIALHELDLPFEAVKVDLATHTLPDGSDYYTVNPKGYVPLLLLDDGTRLTEAHVVLQYIADLRPGRLAPEFGTIERWKLMVWLGFIATEVHKGFGPLWSPQTLREVRDTTIQALNRRFELLADTLAGQPFLTGEDFTIADAYLFVLLNWTKVHNVDISRWPSLGEFQARVGERPAVQDTLRKEGLAD